MQGMITSVLNIKVYYSASWLTIHFEYPLKIWLFRDTKVPSTTPRKY